MKFIAIDTNAYRAFDDGDSAIGGRLQQATSIGIPVIVLGELYFGFENGTRKSDNLARLQRVLDNPRMSILQLDTETARIFGEISAELEAIGKRIQQNDVWIAALCKQYGYALLTGDNGFSHIKGLDIIQI